MSLSPSEQARLAAMLSKLETRERHRVLASIESFTGWLRNACWDIFYKIADAISDMWGAIKDFFTC